MLPPVLLRLLQVIGFKWLKSWSTGDRETVSSIDQLPPE